MEKLLTTKELAAEIKMAESTIRNYKHDGIFKLGVHYKQRKKKSKVFYILSAVNKVLCMDIDIGYSINDDQGTIVEEVTYSKPVEKDKVIPFKQRVHNN
jgi:hypothetical protein